MSEDDSWCTIESDPGVFTEVIEGIGVKGVQVEELYELDQDVCNQIKPIYGLIFLFKWDEALKDNRETCEPPEVFFAQQVIPNACATQAILSVLLNSNGIEVGPELSEFKAITKEFPPSMKGLAISNSALIKKIHNSFARPEPFSIAPIKNDEGEAFHFISYVPVNGHLYELDGLQPGPIYLGECTDEDWITKVIPIIRKRIERYSSKEIRFNLMAIIKNKKEVFAAQIEKLREKKAETEALLKGVDVMRVGDTPSDKESLQKLLEETNDKIEQLQGYIANEETKFANWRAENIRRKHNYVPFLFNLLKVLAEKDLLVPLIERAKEKHKEKKK